MATGPAMFDTTRLNRAVGIHGPPASATGLKTATLDEVLCITTI
jgi:hypothetical protein